MDKKFLLNRTDAKLMGVAAGIADYTGADPLIIRVALVLAVLVTGPLAIVLYIVTGWLAAAR
jgi:phage shock protein C